MGNKLKIGRNDYCHCGSGLKYKKCHLLKKDSKLNIHVPLQVLRDLRRQKNAQKLQDKIRKKERGEVRQTMSCDTPLGKFVAVGSKIYKTDNSADFHSFLLAYAIEIIGESWIKEEHSANGTSHIICKWYVDTFKTAEYTKNLKSSPRNFSYKPLLSLAYDLFVLDDHCNLQNTIVARLRHHDQFSGARYELFVAATCIRAGYELEFEDETDRLTRHFEFIATHKVSGQKIHVEAKKSHSLHHNYGKLINSALGKVRESPLLVFVDINKSPSVAQKYLKNGNKKIEQLLSRLTKSKDNKDIFKLIIFTNHPYQHATQEVPCPEYSNLIIESSTPSNEPEDKRLLKIIKKAITQYGTIPKAFPSGKAGHSPHFFSSLATTKKMT